MTTQVLKTSIRNSLERMNCRQVMVRPESAGMMTDMITNFREAMNCTDDDYAEKSMLALRDQMCDAYGFSSSTQDKPFAFYNGVAIIPVHGSLINRYGGTYYGMLTGYQFIRRQRSEAMADPDVEMIVYDINSNGGEAAGCFELSDESYNLRGEKPTLAVVDSNCYSAAYAFASSADKIAVTPSGGAGSIGVISMHVDMSKMLDDIGIKITLITGGEHKADGNPFEELSAEVRAEIQADVDATRDVFISTVARNRGLDEKVVRDTEARCYSAQDALSLGLIDTVATPTEALSLFISGPSGSDNEEEEQPMKPEDQNASKPETLSAEAHAAAVEEGKKAEQTRISGIMSCEAATGRSKLANHLAFSTTMSVEDAQATLAASGLDPVQAAAVDTKTNLETPKPENNANHFANAMNNSQHPNVGADNGDEGLSAEEKADRDDVNSLMSSYTKATGFQFDKK